MSTLANTATATQCAAILAWLQSGKSITPKEALDEFGCMRLGARIYDLKQQGHEIVARNKKVEGRNGPARVAEYSLAGGAQ